MIWAALAAFITIFSTGCEQTISLGVNDYDPKVVVMSHCEVDSLPLVFLSLSESSFGYVSGNDPNGTMLTSWLSGATVTLTDDKGHSQTLTGGKYRTDIFTQYIDLPDSPYYRIDTIYWDILAYKGTEAIKADVAYTLKVEHNNKTYTATASSTERVKAFLPEVKTETTSDWGQIYVQNFLQWTGTPNTEKTYKITTSYIVKYIQSIPIYDTLPNGSIVFIGYETDTISYPYKGAIRNTITANGSGINSHQIYSYTQPPNASWHDTVNIHVSVSPVADEENRFFDSYYKQLNVGISNPFNEPVAISSNIQNGLGYFSITHSRDTTIQIITPR